MKKFYSFLIATTVLSFGSISSAYDNPTPQQSFDAVMEEGAYILDVRTAAEFIWVGHPNVPNVINIPWKIEQKGSLILNPSFISDVNDIFGSNKGVHIIVMCRSGVRSIPAAVALEADGYTNVSNMFGGFEGEGIDGYGYRTVDGWKNTPLPGHTSAVDAVDYYPD